MNKQKWTLILVTLVLMGGTAGALVRMKSNQRLGLPGIKTKAISGSKRLEIYLPPQVLGYDSHEIPTDTNVLDGLPSDTSFAQRRYENPSGDWHLLNVVLMGTDRTSIHKPQFCLSGSGWNISDAESSSDTIRIERPQPYNLPVMKLVSSREVKINGEMVPVRGIYVYWFVTKDRLTESHWTRMGWMSSHLLATGELQRWAYVSLLAVCRPGEEAKTYERVKKFIAASVPEFQLAASEAVTGTASPQLARH